MEVRWRGKGGEGTVLLDISLVASNAQLQTPTIGSWSRRAMEIGSTVRSAFPNLPVYLTPTTGRISKEKAVFLNDPISSLRYKRFASACLPFRSVSNPKRLETIPDNRESRFLTRRASPFQRSLLEPPLFSSIRGRKMEIPRAFHSSPFLLVNSPLATLPIRRSNEARCVFFSSLPTESSLANRCGFRARDPTFTRR